MGAHHPLAESKGAGGRVRVTWVPSHGLAAAHFDRLVCASERDRAANYRQSADRWRSIVGAGALRVAVGRELGLAAQDVVIDRTCPTCDKPHGRPTVPGADLHVSLAHAGDWVVVATSTLAPVGVDVEPCKAASRTRLPRDLILGPDEEANTYASVLAAWVAKEAYLKALGIGLTVEMSQVSLRGGALTLPGHPSGRIHWLAGQRGHLAVVCVTGSVIPPVTESELAVSQPS